MPRVDFSLYVITDWHQTVGRSLPSVVNEALEHGAGAVQIREKELPVRSLLTLTRDIVAQTTRCGAHCFVNDRVDVCLSVPGVGIHLRSNSLPVNQARRLVGLDRLIAVSTHSSDEVQRAEQHGADFVVLGPVYDTPSKRAFGPPDWTRCHRYRSTQNEPSSVCDRRHHSGQCWRGDSCWSIRSRSGFNNHVFVTGWCGYTSVVS